MLTNQVRIDWGISANERSSLASLAVASGLRCECALSFRSIKAAMLASQQGGRVRMRRYERQGRGLNLGEGWGQNLESQM